MDDVAGGDGVSGVDFSDEKKAQAWLKTQSNEAMCAIASRAALRVCANISLIGADHLPSVTLPVLRAILTSAVRGSGRLVDVDWKAIKAVKAVTSLATYVQETSSARSAAIDAAQAAFNALGTASDLTAFSDRDFYSTAYDAAFNAAYDAADSAAHSAHHSGGHSSAARSTTDDATSNDSANIWISSFLTPIWPAGTIPQSIQERHESLLAFFNEHRSTWGFWQDWYLAMWEGRWTNWDLAHDVAKIPDDVWEEGAEAVAIQIEKIRAAQLRDRLPQAEVVAFDAETLTFSARPIAMQKPDLIGATLQQVEDSLEDVLASPSNGLSNTSREVRVIERTLRKYGNNPQQIEMGFVSAHAGLTRQLIVEELPASEENLALRSALEEGAVAIRATHPDVAENRAILTKRKFEELSPEQKDQLAEALPVLRAFSDEALADDWSHDIPALINTSMGPVPEGAPPLLGADEATRIFSRAAKISILLRSKNVIDQIDQSAGYKAAGIVATIGTLVTLGWALL